MFTPRDQKAVKAAAQTFRQNKALDVETAITELAVGEALVSFLDEKGQPGVVDRALIYLPQSQLAPLSDGQRQRVIKQSTLYGHYEKIVDRESAYEMLKGRAPRVDGAPLPNNVGTGWQSEAGKLLARAPRMRSAAKSAGRLCAACWARSSVRRRRENDDRNASYSRRMAVRQKPTSNESEFTIP